MIGDKSKDVIILTPKDPILSLCHIYDWMGSELVQDKDSDVKYTVLLNKKMQLPVHSPEEGEEQEVIKTREIVDSKKIVCLFNNRWRWCCGLLNFTQTTLFCLFKSLLNALKLSMQKKALRKNVKKGEEKMFIKIRIVNLTTYNQ